jgi:hypothetical protein
MIGNYSKARGVLLIRIDDLKRLDELESFASEDFSNPIHSLEREPNHSEIITPATADRAIFSEL